MMCSDLDHDSIDTVQQTDFAALARHLDLQPIRALSDKAWLARQANGDLAVLKTGPGASHTLQDFLRKMAALHPPFAYPRVLAGRPDCYFVYDYLPGSPLSEGDFEAAAVLAGVFDLSGRLTALFRSLKLAPLVQGLHRQATGAEQSGRPAAKRLAALGASLGQRQDGLAVRRWEASQSYAWAQAIVARCAASWPTADSRLAPAWSALAARVETITSIHLAVHGSSLAHTAFTPEHLLPAQNDVWGVVGWRVAPRPYNYMRYRYLAWCLVHSPHGDLENRYRRFLADMPAIHSAAAHPLTFALTLLETWVEAGGAVTGRQEKLRAIGQFVTEALDLPVPAEAAVPLG